MPRGIPRIARRPKLAEQTYAALCDAIVSGNLMPGQRIILDRVAQDLGVSPTPLREAIARLVQDGLLVESADGKLRVVPLTPQYVHDTFWVRAALEGLAAELATPVLSEADLQELDTAFEETSQSLQRGKLDRYISADARFHQLVAESARNATLLRELDALKTHVAFIRGYSQRRAGDHIRKSHEEHLIVFGYLKERDAERSRRAMEAHIRRTSERIVRLIEFSDEGGKASSE
jgi:DNA-binding GntR family transcriptional regulator